MKPRGDRYCDENYQQKVFLDTSIEKAHAAWVSSLQPHLQPGAPPKAKAPKTGIMYVKDCDPNDLMRVAEEGGMFKPIPVDIDLNDESWRIDLQHNR